MRLPKNYENTVSNNFTSVRLGGHVCKILKASEYFSKNGKPMLLINFDICDGEFANHYRKQYEERKKNNKDISKSIKWGGTIYIMTEDQEGNCSKRFKGVMEALEQSNNNFNVNNISGEIEPYLTGLIFGGVFGREEYEASDGSYKFATKLMQIKKREGIENAEVPKDKLLNKDNSFDSMIPIDDGDMPF